jgi:pimeloyl-ACP methyl ester carboxylesterase
MADRRAGAWLVTPMRRILARPNKAWVGWRRENRRSKQLLHRTIVLRRMARTSFASGSDRPFRYGLAAAAGITGLAGAAFYNAAKRREAEAATPPIGGFVEVDGVRLHYLERGEGPPLVLLHGNGATIQDFLLSGVIDLAAQRYRVIAFDRPGFGYSERPRSTLWTPAAQASLIMRALEQLGVARPIVLGHSWGTLVALAMALDFPESVSGLVLASGFYFPEPRGDVLMVSPPAIPVIGDLVRHTLSPLAGRAMAPMLFKTMFSPLPVPEIMSEWPLGLAVRPSQIRAGAADAAFMVPAAAALSKRHGELAVPLVIIAGVGDKIADFLRHAHALHDAVPGSELIAVEGAGHMVHYAAPERVLEVTDRVAGMAAPTSEPTAKGEDIIPPTSASAF